MSKMSAGIACVMFACIGLTASGAELGVEDLLRQMRLSYESVESMTANFSVATVRPTSTTAATNEASIVIRREGIAFSAAVAMQIRMRDGTTQEVVTRGVVGPTFVGRYHADAPRAEVWELGEGEPIPKQVISVKNSLLPVSDPLHHMFGNGHELMWDRVGKAPESAVWTVAGIPNTQQYVLTAGRDIDGSLKVMHQYVIDAAKGFVVVETRDYGADGTVGSSVTIDYELRDAHWVPKSIERVKGASKDNVAVRERTTFESFQINVPINKADLSLEFLGVQTGERVRYWKRDGTIETRRYGGDGVLIPESLSGNLLDSKRQSAINQTPATDSQSLSVQPNQGARV